MQAPRLTAELLHSWQPQTRAAFLASLTPDDKAALAYRWPFWARDKQLAPEGDWRVWLVLAGRGFGKTRTGVEWVRGEVEAGRRGRLALVAPTAADVRDVMIEGESGIMAISPPWFRPKYEPSKRRLSWPNGAIATTYSADEPDRLRGPQHDGALCDELAAWRYPDAWDMLMFGLRLGADPRAVVTTTPRPVRLVRELLKSKTTAVTTGSTYENAANLAPAFIDAIVAKYEGSRLGRQELYAEVLDDNPGALWKRAQIDSLRVTAPPDMERVIVAIDPAASNSEGSAETGIVVAGRGRDGHGYILEDRSLRGTPDQWARAAVTAYHVHHADMLVYETNQGGDMVAHTLRTVDENAPTKGVRATRGKYLRAEPVAALYEQGRVHHVGAFADLEDQMCGWTPGDTSPDRLDALVWALTDLMIDNGGTWGILDW